MREISIISVAFGKDYQRFIKPFMEMAGKFSDDVIVETNRAPMGTMRNRACEKAKYDYIISLDIDDTILNVPEPTTDFVGLGWIERGEEKGFWLPGEKRSPDNTIRSNIMFSKDLWLKCRFIDHDYYIYKFIEGAFLNGFTFSKAGTSVVYNRRDDSLSSLSDKQHDEASEMLRSLMRKTRMSIESVTV